jgi:hypothetical protein
MALLKLYKYHKYDTYLFELLSRHEFYCATRKQLNDPFDLGNFKFTEVFLKKLFQNHFSINSERIWRKLNISLTKGITGRFTPVELTQAKINYLLKDNSAKREFINAMIDDLDYRVVSFSGDQHFAKEILMWSHYAKYDGVRLSFEFDSSDIFRIYNADLKFEKVDYEGNMPDIKDETHLKDSFIYKHEFWNYENEYRLISKSLPYIDFNKDCLKKIEFGMNMSKLAMYSIITICQKLGYGCDFEIYNIEKDVGK